MVLHLAVLENTYAIYRFHRDTPIPAGVYSSDFFSITKTKDELSVVTLQNELFLNEAEINKDWRIIKVIGPLDFSLVGIIADLSEILKQEKISIFTISTYDTDYILVKQKDLSKAIVALQKNGHLFNPECKA